jgi:hypothetical protein
MRQPREPKTPKPPRERRHRIRVALAKLKQRAARPDRPAVLADDESRAARAGTLAAVLLVAVIAAIVSFVHIENLAITHGQTWLAAILLPVSIDGTVAGSSLVMVRAARARITTPWLARTMLLLSVVATLAANLAYGAKFGVTGALLSGWPALAFVGSAEMAIGMVRRVRRAQPAGMAGDVVSSGIPADVVGAAEASLRVTLAAGNPWSVNQLAERFSLSRSQATRVRDGVLATSNGHAPS